MTFEFENIGPVEHATLDLADFTIIAGRNNTGKTYLVYALYGFLKQWPGWPAARSFFFDSPANHAIKPLQFRRLARDIVRVGHAHVKVDADTLHSAGKTIVDRLAHDFSVTALPTVFSSSSEEFKTARISVDITGDRSGLLSESTTELAFPSIGRLVLEYDGTMLSVTSKLTNPSRPFRREHVRILLPHVLTSFLCHFPTPFILSAERFGISLFYKELDFAKSHLVDLLQKMGNDDKSDSDSPFLLIDKNTSRYAQPIKDNIDFTRNVHDITRHRGPLADHKFFDDIKHIMDGYYQASKDVIRFRSKARGKHKFNIPLHLASSSARGLADLYFYLRHQAEQGHLLIVDEPESHLDTHNQVLLARILARFVNAGIKVLVTTHSDYLVKEINNLIMLGEMSDGQNETLAQWGYSASNVLKRSSIRAYVADKHQLRPAVIDQYGISMSVFDDTIDHINKISNSLVSAIEKKNDIGS